jgi:hypothetical protein
MLLLKARRIIARLAAYNYNCALSENNAARQHFLLGL